MAGPMSEAQTVLSEFDADALWCEFLNRHIVPVAPDDDCRHISFRSPRRNALGPSQRVQRPNPDKRDNDQRNQDAYGARCVSSDQTEAEAENSQSNDDQHAACCHRSKMAKQLDIRA